jgi:hypothetical protein
MGAASLLEVLGAEIEDPEEGRVISHISWRFIG